ncbi:MAG: DHH family phosphoesterase [Clostridiales bacterium]|nr:DHH family phosphoesterase [Clostridiales bacterium]
MRLSELLQFEDIVIQCHDNPDADALASGYALYFYLTEKGRFPRFIYRGKNPVTKSNLLIMLDRLKIPVTYEPDFEEEPELLVTVDCQYGQRNVTTTKAKNIAVIDHHQVTVELPPMSEVRSGVGSCSTVIWNMIRSEGMNVNWNKFLPTAIYYGLFTDTNRLSEVAHPLDRDMLDELDVNMSIIKEMSNSNISLRELMITGRAILENKYFPGGHYLIIRSEPCDPNILGVISDFSLEAEGVDICIAYYESAYEIKFSVRSCIKEVHANELAEFLSKGIGGGGGHVYKAGGTIRPELLGKPISEIFEERLEQYSNMFTIIHAKDVTLSTDDMKVYDKLPQILGTVRLADVFPIGTMVEIRTLEGDVNIKVTADTYVMIGLEGEIYPISEEKLRRSYSEIGGHYNRDFEYEPCIKDSINGEKKGLMEYSRAVMSLSKSRIFAKPLDTYVKIFTEWDDEKYYLGRPGDYIAIRQDDAHDIYVINGRLFDQLYSEVLS